MNPDQPVLTAADADADARSWTVFRRTVVTVLIAFALLQPAINRLNRPLDGRGWFEVIGAVVLAGLVCWHVSSRELGSRSAPWLALSLILVLGIALFAVGGANWIAILAITAAAFGRYSQTPVPAFVGAAACGAAGLVVSVVNGYQSGLTVAATIIAPLAGLFAYSAGRRADTMNMLRRTRAELARAAVAEERLRIARDLHDLLGHSLSLITLKAELAGRVIGADPDRAAREIAELELVARQSLSDVREAVAGFASPTWPASLVAARQLLEAAGIASEISAPGTGDLPQEIDAALAWAVREGTTNAVRHSKATYVAIRVTSGAATVTAEISDNGPAAAEVATGTGTGAGTPAALTTGPAGRAAAGRAGPGFAGSGLAGLAERVRRLGGDLAAGVVEPHGFLLRVVVPLPAGGTMGG